MTPRLREALALVVPPPPAGCSGEWNSESEGIWEGQLVARGDCYEAPVIHVASLTRFRDPQRKSG